MDAPFTSSMQIWILKGLLNLCALSISLHVNRIVFFDSCFCCDCEFARGSQRERDRERALARTGGKGKNKDDGLTPEQRRER